MRRTYVRYLIDGVGCFETGFKWHVSSFGQKHWSLQTRKIYIISIFNINCRFGNCLKIYLRALIFLLC